MKGKGESLTSEITHITNQIRQLKLQQQQLEDRLVQVQHELERKPEHTTHRGVAHYHIIDDGSTERIVVKAKRPLIDRRRKSIKAHKEYAYDSVNSPEIGDEVRIVNPKPGQHNQGTVEGFCTDGKLKIRTKQGKIVTRQPKNVRYQVSYTY